MIWQFDLVLLILAILAVIAAIEVRDLFAAAVFLGVFSFIMCMVWTEMGSVDVAFTEAAVGAGVSTAFFIAAVYKTTRRTKD